MAEINLLALIVAAVVTLPIGYVWYGMLFSKAWMAETGMTEEKAKNSNPAVVYGLSLLFSFFMAFMLQFIVIHQYGVEGLVAGTLGKLPSYTAFAADYSNEFRSFGHGALHGTMAGILLIFPMVAVNALHEQKSWKYILINSGYWTLCLLVMGGIICAWK